MMLRRVVKMGNNLAVRIPRKITLAMQLQRGDYVVLLYPRPGVLTIERLEVTDASGTRTRHVSRRPD